MTYILSILPLQYIVLVYHESSVVYKPLTPSNLVVIKQPEVYFFNHLSSSLVSGLFIHRSHIVR